MVYLDYAASTPVDEKVLNNFIKVTKKYYANPNSTHDLGLAAANLITESSKNIAEILGCTADELIYTSGATEANNLVIKGICQKYQSYGKHIILSNIEHSSLIAPATYMQKLGFEVDLIEVNSEGLIDIKKLEKMIREDTILVSICSIDSEVGIIQPIEQIASLLKKYPNCFFHTDASQAIGKINIDFTNVDLITIAPHKFYGMNGVGLLVKRKQVSLIPLIHGGKSTTIYRSGTPVVANVTSLELALKIAYDKLQQRSTYVSKLNELLKNSLTKYSKVHINSIKNCVPFTLNISIKSIDSNVFAQALAKENIYVSTKSACSSNQPLSKVVLAITQDEDLARSSLRISLSHLTTIDQINTFLQVFDKIYKECCYDGKI